MKKRSNLRSVPFGTEKKSHTLKTSLITHVRQGNIVSFLFSNSLYALSTTIFKYLRLLFGIKAPQDLSIIDNKLKVHVVDVGAADGYHPRWDNLGSSLEVSCFEPEESAFQLLKDEYKNNKSIHAYNTMVSSKAEKVTLYLTAWNRGAGVYKPGPFTELMDSKKMYKVVDQIEFSAKPLKDTCKPFDFIKVDTQGHELPILEGSGNLIDQCIGMELEVGFNDKIYNKKATNFGDLHKFCTDKGFTMCELKNPYYRHYLLPNRDLESKGFLAYSDAIYFRFPEDIIDLVKSKKFNKKKIHSALMLYLLYNNYEFAFTLNKLARENKYIKEDTYNLVNNLIYKTSGADKIISNRILKHIEGYFSGRGVNSTLGY